MASKAFLDALKNAKANKKLDSLVVNGSSRYMREGTHDVTIVGVDAKDLESNRIKVTLENGTGEQHTGTIFIMNGKKAGELGYGFRALLSGLFDDTAAFETLIDEILSGNDNAFNMLVGMKSQVVLEYGRGYYPEQDPAGRYVGMDRETKQQVIGPFDTIEELKEQARARNIYRSFEQIKRWSCLNGPANVNALNVAVEGRRKAKTARGGIGVPGFVSGPAVAKLQ